MQPKPPKEDKGPPPPFEPWLAIKKEEYKPIKVCHHLSALPWQIGFSDVLYATLCPARELRHVWHHRTKALYSSVLMRNNVADNCIFWMQVRWAGDRCSVCDSDVDFDSDQLVSCDMCGITVHQSCYGVPELPGVDDMWLCRACELKVHHA